MPTATNIGQIVRRLRERWKLTQQDVVEYARLDRSASYISSIETGKTSPTLAELEAMAVVFRTTAIEMIQAAQGTSGEAVPGDEGDAPWEILFRSLPPERQQFALDFLRFLAQQESARRD